MQSTSYIRFALEDRRFIAFGFLVAFSSSFGQTYFIGVFGPDLRAEFGLSHGEWSLVFMAGTLASAVVLPWSGRLIDRIDLRVFTAAVYVGLAAACFVTAIADHVAVLVFAIFLLRHLGQGLMSHTSVTSMVRYFDADRGKAVGLGAVGFSAGQAILPIAAVLAIAAFGWRPTYAAMGGVLALVVVPGALWLLKGHGERHQRHLDGLSRRVLDQASDRQWTRAEVLRDPRFYVLLIGVLASSVIGTALLFHQLHLADVKGWSHGWITGNYVVYAVASLTTMVVAGRLVDRVGALRLVPLHLGPLVFGAGRRGGVRCAPVGVALPDGHGNDPRSRRHPGVRHVGRDVWRAQHRRNQERGIGGHGLRLGRGAAVHGRADRRRLRHGGHLPDLRGLRGCQRRPHLGRLARRAKAPRRDLDCTRSGCGEERRQPCRPRSNAT